MILYSPPPGAPGVVHLPEGGGPKAQAQVDLRTVQAAYEATAEEVNRLTLLLTDLSRSIETVDALKRAGGGGDEVGPLIIPVGNFLSIIVPSVRVDEVLVALGSNVYAKMGLDAAREELSRRVEQVKAELTKTQANLRQLEAVLVESASAAGRTQAAGGGRRRGG